MKKEKTKIRSQVERVMLDRGITFMELTRAGNITAQQLSPIIKGETKSYQIPTIQKLCNGLRCTPNDLFRGVVVFKEVNLNIK